MGKRGPRKKPAKVHKQRGTFQPCRHAEPDVKPAAGIPEPPELLSEKAKKYWQSIGKQLHQAGLLADLDGIALWLLAESIELYVTASEEVSAGRLTCMGESGNEYQAPAVAIRNKAWAQVVKLCQEFGMTPSARTGLNVESKPVEDEKLAQILGFKVLG